MSYKPEPLPLDIEGMTPALREQWERDAEDLHEAQFHSQDRILLTKFAAPPAKPEKGAMYYADGSTWNPSQGEGYYRYSSTNKFIAMSVGLNVLNFGAIGDGVVDDTVAIQAAINALPSTGGLIVIPSGKYKTSATINIFNNGVSIRGDSTLGTEILASNAAQSVFQFGDGTASYESGNIQDIAFNITGLAAKTTGAAIFINKFNNISFKNIRIANHFWGVRASNSVLVFGSDTNIINCTPVNGVGIFVDGTTGNDHYFVSIFVQTISGGQPRAGFEFTFSTASWLINCGALSTGNGLLIDPASGQVVQHMFMSLNAYDTCSGHGILLQNSGTGIINRIQSTQDWASTNQLNGVTINVSNGEGFDFSQLRAYNNQQHGVQILSGPGVRLLASRIEGNGGAALGSFYGVIFGANILNFTVKDCVIGGFEGFGVIQKFGVVVSAGCNAFRISDNDLRQNISGGLLNLATPTLSSVLNNF